jgi:hypothetical protein
MSEGAWVRLGGFLAAVLTAGAGLFLIWDRLRKTDQGIGENILKALGTVLLLSTIIAGGSAYPDR